MTEFSQTLSETSEVRRYTRMSIERCACLYTNSNFDEISWSRFSKSNILLYSHLSSSEFWPVPNS